MNNSKTPKIVIGVGLAAVYAVGLSLLVLRGAHDNTVAQGVAVAPPAQVAAADVPPPAVAAAPVSEAARVIEAAPVPEAPPAMEAKPVVKAKPVTEPMPRIRQQETVSAPVALPTDEAVADESRPASEGNSQGSAEVEPPAATPAPESAIEDTTGVVDEPEPTIAN